MELQPLHQPGSRYQQLFNEETACSTYWKCHVEERVYCSRQLLRSKQVFVLRPDGGNEKVHPQHLKNSEESNENEPGRQHLLPRGLAVQCAPNATLLLPFFLFLDSMLPFFGITKQLVQLGQIRFTMVSSSFTQAADFTIAEFIIRVMIITSCILILFDLPFELGLGLVRIRIHDRQLEGKNQDRHNGIPVKELLRRESTI